MLSILVNHLNLLFLMPQSNLHNARNNRFNFLIKRIYIQGW